MINSVEFPSLLSYVTHLSLLSHALFLSFALSQQRKSTTETDAILSRYSERKKIGWEVKCDKYHFYSKRNLAGFQCEIGTTRSERYSNPINRSYWKTV